MPANNSDEFDAANLSAKASLDAPTMTSLFKPFMFVAFFLALAACAGRGSVPGSLAYVANKSGNNTNPVYDFSDVDTRDATDSKGQGFSPRSIATTRTLQ